jgi:hypothetical protein
MNYGIQKGNASAAVAGAGQSVVRTQQPDIQNIPEHTPQVGQQLSYLEGIVTDLTDMSYALAKKLEPILTPQPAGQQQGIKEAAAMAPLAESLAIQYARLCDILERLQNINSRIEL